MTDKELRQKLDHLLKLNFNEEGNKVSLVKAIRRIINEETKKLL